MAEGGSVENKSLEELDSEITCGICQEHYTEPKTLPCLHYYCKQCILTLALRSATGKPFYCPECRCAATLPEGGVDQLKTAFFINRLKSKVTTIERVHGKVEVKCELCENSAGNAEAFCRQCAMFICGECVRIHNKLKTHKTHDIASLDDLKHGRAKTITEKEPLTQKCEVHEEPLVLFCFDCARLICQHCTLKDHRDHDFEFTKKAAANIKAKLVSDVEPLSEIHSMLSQGVDRVSATKQKVEAQKDSVINTIRTSFKELHVILDQQEKKLVGEANELAQQKVSKLSAQEKNLSLADAEVRSVLEYTERCVSLSTDNEVMSMHTEIGKAIEQKIQEHNEAGKSLEPVEVADMGVEVRCGEALEQLCQTQAVYIGFIAPAKCTVDLPEHAEVGKLFKVTLITRLSNNKQVMRNCKVSSQIKSLHNGVITDCNIDEDGSGRYSIQCTPTVRGRYELTVLIDGQHVADSPFPVYVSIHPTQLGKPVKVWGELAGPVGITANSTGEILVMEQKRSIFKFPSDKPKEIIVSFQGLEMLRDIACDDEDSIYCIDQQTNEIFTCDKNGGKRKTHTVELDKGVPGLSALCIINNDVFICEIFKSGTIKVYDRDLKYVRKIQHKDMSYYTGLSTDIQDYIYACDYHNSLVCVFNNNGDFVCSIGADMKELKHPWGVCVSGQYVYVTDTTSHCVFVFTTDGDYVTSFGQYGSNEGDFNWPTSVYVDKDGFVFVCDLLNHRVQVF